MITITKGVNNTVVLNGRAMSAVFEAGMLLSQDGDVANDEVLLKHLYGGASGCRAKWGEWVINGEAPISALDAVEKLSAFVGSFRSTGGGSGSGTQSEADPMFAKWLADYMVDGKFRPEIIPTDINTTNYKILPTQELPANPSENITYYTHVGDGELQGHVWDGTGWNIVSGLSLGVDLSAYALKTDVENVVTYQVPARYNYAGSQTFILPKAPEEIAEVRTYDPNGTYTLVQDGNYSVSDKDVTIISPKLSDGMRVAIFYYAK